MRVVDPAPGRWEWGPNTNLGKGPQSRSRFPTAEPRDTAEAPSRNAAPKESRGLGDNQGGTGCGGTGPTPQTPRAGAELPGRKGLVGGSAAFPAGSGRREPFCVGRAEAATTTPGPRPRSRAHIHAHVRAHNNSRECRGRRIRGRSCALGVSSGIIYCYPLAAGAAPEGAQGEGHGHGASAAEGTPNPSSQPC